jgi:Leucine-rich repeat (LRR) protein
MDVIKWMDNGCDKIVGNFVISLNISNNNLTILPPEIGDLINLQRFYCFQNKLTTLPLEIGNLINLHILCCSKNNLITLPSTIGNLINLQRFYCFQNKLTTLAPEICHLNNLRTLYYHDNPIEYINPQIIRFLNRNKYTQKIYNDAQTVHNHNIQKCITESIQYIMSNKPTLNVDNLNELILNNKIVMKQYTRH